MIAVHTVEDAFSPAECAALLHAVRATPASDARLVGQNRDHNIRRADLVWLDDLEGTDWVMERIIDVVRTVNRSVYDFAIEAFAESPQVARYGAERKGHFNWHSDIGDGPTARKRKLTMVAQLSNPEDYEGGTLEIWPSSVVLEAPKGTGALTVFPSYILHRVTPVTSGERFSLTQWAHGPAFR